MSNIFESPDGGKTIYKRVAGESQRTLVAENTEKAQVTVLMDSSKLNEFQFVCNRQNIEILEVKR